MNKDKVDLTLSALFHDIGKFKQRCGYETDKGKTHSQIGYEWLSLSSQYGEGVISAGARNHHGNEKETWESNLTLIIYEADNCAASERKTSFDPKADDYKEWHREIQLANIFSRVRSPSDVKTHPSPSFNGFKPIDNWNKPIDKHYKNSTEDYQNLWDQFEAEFSVLKQMNQHRNVEAINHLLEKYTSFIPSITLKIYNQNTEEEYRKHPDVSLYDHLKLTAAIALCLRDYYIQRYYERWNKEILKAEIIGDQQDIFTLIGGDISGIQKFIYTISSKGALKSLKGRSFFLELLTQHVVDRLLEELKLSCCNVIFTGGGHFYLIAPNIPDTSQVVETVRKEINDYLFESFNGAIQQFIETVPFGKDDFKDASAVWSSLSSELETAKLRKWERRIEDVFKSPENPHKNCLKDNCQVCWREDLALTQLSESDSDMEDIKVCKPCREQFLLGKMLQHAVRKGKPVIYRLNSECEDSVRIEKYYYKISYKERFINEPLTVFHLNDWDLKNFKYSGSRPLLAGIYMPKNKECQDIEGLLKNGFGINKQAVLRMDVDYLGRIFSESIPENERTFSRMASLSRQLSLFFKYHLNGIMENRNGYPEPFKIVERDGERLVSIVYSGGDDVFLIGHWLDITEAAFDINKAFQEFTANKYITISGGIALGDVHDPVYRLAELAGTAEKAAKNNDKNSVTLFDVHTFKWKETEEIKKLLCNFVQLTDKKEKHLYLPDDSVSKAGLYKFLTIIREHKKEEKMAWIFPKLAYIFGRLKPSEKFLPFWETIKNRIFSKDVNWHHLEIAILWTLMMMRKEDNVNGL